MFAAVSVIALFETVISSQPQCSYQIAKVSTMKFNRKTFLFSAIGCGAVILIITAATAMLVTIPFQIVRTDSTGSDGLTPTADQQPAAGSSRAAQRIAKLPQSSVPTLTPPVQTAVDRTTAAQIANDQSAVPEGLVSSSSLLTQRYAELNPGVVNIGVVAELSNGQQGGGAGSGFVLDEDGHIVTNNHVIDQANQVVVVFFNGLQAPAEIIGTDDDSDLAIIKVEQLPEDVYPLPVADSDQVQVGDWAIAIGNPFGLGSSMTLGIVSAIGRSIPSGATPFSIPQAIQTDAAINPGNSGGPLLNLSGQVIGVNAQIRTGGGGGNAGVGFAIPANVVRHIAPVLIVNGFYEWPWLGVSGSRIDLTLMQANDLETQRGAYITNVVPGGAADKAGLRGARIVERNGFRIPVGGDVVTAIDDVSVADFDDLMTQIAFKSVDDETVLTILRDGDQRDVSVRLGARPSDFAQRQ